MILSQIVSTTKTAISTCGDQIQIKLNNSVRREKEIDGQFFTVDVFCLLLSSLLPSRLAADRIQASAFSGRKSPCIASHRISTINEKISSAQFKRLQSLQI